jgi:hypothetical protein
MDDSFAELFLDVYSTTQKQSQNNHKLVYMKMFSAVKMADNNS